MLHHGVDDKQVNQKQQLSSIGDTTDISFDRPTLIIRITSFEGKEVSRSVFLDKISLRFLVGGYFGILADYQSRIHARTNASFWDTLPGEPMC